MQKHFRSLAAVAIMACAAIASAAATVGEATRDTLRGGVAFVTLTFGALCAMPAMFAAAVLPAPWAAKVERAGWLVWYHVGTLAAQARAMLGSWVFALMCRHGLILRAFPGTVSADLAFGVPGELAFDGPYRSQPARINHATAADIVIGRWFTLAADGTAMPGGAGAIGGVLMSPKTHVSLGTAAGGSLAPTMTLPTGTMAEFCYMGAVVVSVGAAVALASPVKYNTTTGIIGAGAPGAGEAAVPNAKFIRYANAAAGLAVLELTN